MVDYALPTQEYIFAQGRIASAISMVGLFAYVPD
jgi:hypothetical protein